MHAVPDYTRATRTQRSPMISSGIRPSVRTGAELREENTLTSQPADRGSACWGSFFKPEHRAFTLPIDAPSALTMGKFTLRRKSRGAGAKHKPRKRSPPTHPIWNRIGRPAADLNWGERPPASRAHSMAFHRSRGASDGNVTSSECHIWCATKYPLTSRLHGRASLPFFCFSCVFLSSFFRLDFVSFVSFFRLSRIFLLSSFVFLSPCFRLSFVFLSSFFRLSFVFLLSFFCLSSVSL